MKTYNTQSRMRAILILLAITVFSQNSFGKGIFEGTRKKEEKNLQVSSEKNFIYTSIPSNEGLLYIFKEHIALPEYTSRGQLIIQDISPTSPHVSNFSIDLTNTKSNFEFVLNTPQNVFYPLIPQLATLTLYDTEGSPLRSSHTNFSAGLVFNKEIESVPNFLVLDPLVLSNSNINIADSNWNNSFTDYVDEDNTFFNEIYKQSDESLMDIISSQFVKAVEKTKINTDNAYLLISGVNLNSDFDLESYMRLLSKAELFRNKLINLNMDYFKNFQISTDALLEIKSSDDYKNNLYPSSDQIVLRISDSKEEIEKAKQKHMGKNRAFFKLISQMYYDNFSYIEEYLDTIEYNFSQAQSEYFKSQQLMKLSTAQVSLKKSDDLEYRLGKWTENTDNILTTFRNIQNQISSIQQSSNDSNSLNSMIELMNISGVQDNSLLKGLVTLQAGYNDTNTRISEIERDYGKRKKIVSLHRSSNLAYNKMLTEFIDLISHEDSLLNEDYNQLLLNNMPKNLSELKSIFANMGSILIKNIQDNSLDTLGLISNIRKAENLATDFENKVIAISDFMIENYQNSVQNRETLIAHTKLEGEYIDKDSEASAETQIDNSVEDINMLATLKNQLARDANIKNGLHNIIEISAKLREFNTKSEKIADINQATETIDEHVNVIKKKVEPVLHTDKSSILRNTTTTNSLYSSPISSNSSVP